MPESGFPGCTKHPERDRSPHLREPCPGLLSSFSTQGLCFPCSPLGTPLSLRLLQRTRPRPLTPHLLSSSSAWDPVGLTPWLTSLLPRVQPLTTQKLSWMLTVSPTPDYPGVGLPKMSAPAGQGAQIPPPYPLQHSTLNKYLQLVKKKRSVAL